MTRCLTVIVESSPPKSNLQVMKTKKSTKTTKAKATNPVTITKTTKTTKTNQTKSTIDDVNCAWNQEEADEWDREFRMRDEAQTVREEQQLKTGKYTLLKHSDSPEIRMSEIGQKAYNEFLAKGDTEDLAFWRVARNRDYKAFDCAFPRLGLIKNGYEKWVVLKNVTEYGCCEMDPHHSLEFAFEKEKCIDDLTMELLERRGSIIKDEYVKIKNDAKDVELIDWHRERQYY